MRGLALAISMAVLLTACMVRPWTEHAYPAHGFAVSYPGEVVEQAGSPATDGRPALLFAVSGAGQDSDLSVAVVDLAGAAADTATTEAINRIAEGHPVRIAYWATGDQGQHMGRAAVIDEGAGMATTLHVVAYRDRLYEVRARSMGRASPKVKRFLDSFRLIEAPPASNP